MPTTCVGCSTEFQPEEKSTCPNLCCECQEVFGPPKKITPPQERKKKTVKCPRCLNPFLADLEGDYCIYCLKSIEETEPITDTEEEGRLIPTAEQIAFIEDVRDGYNTFLTGCAGTGKSAVIGAAIEVLEEMGKFVLVSALTGVAAANIGGRTLHSVLGIGPIDSDTSVGKLVGRMRASKNVEDIKKADVLIIEECSMLDADAFDKLQKAIRIVRVKSKTDTRPFGGLQVVLLGDFLQLPPISQSGFAFEAHCWSMITRMHVLTKVFRQDNEELQTILDGVRKGKLSFKGSYKLRKCLDTKFDLSDGILPTHLYARKDDVYRMNQQEMEKLTTEKILFKAEFNGDEDQIAELKECIQTPELLWLAIGAQVMYTVNNHPFVNGSRGVVTGFTTSVGMRIPIVKFLDQQEKKVYPHTFKSDNGGTMIQLPLIPAWALTIHKSQGCTLDRASLSMRRIFAEGQAYVALSRIRSLESLHLVDFAEDTIKANKKALDFYDRLATQKDVEKNKQRTVDEFMRPTKKAKLEREADDADEAKAFKVFPLNGDPFFD